MMNEKYDLRVDQDLRDKMAKIIEEQFFPELFPWYIELNQLKTKLTDIETALIQWSRDNRPDDVETQDMSSYRQKCYELWCSMNRLIGKFFGSDWMEMEE